MELIRFPGIQSESGAYIFAPAGKGVPIKVKMLDAFIVSGSL